MGLLMKPRTCTEDVDRSVLIMFCTHTEGDVWGVNIINSLALAEKSSLNKEGTPQSKDRKSTPLAITWSCQE